MNSSQDSFDDQIRPPIDEIKPLLDRDELLSDHFELAEQGQRFANYIIDRIALYLLSFIFGMVITAFTDFLIEFGLGSTFLTVYQIFFGYLISVLYYAVFEIITGKTLGKMITKTRVIDKTGMAPGHLQIVGRSFARIIPFNAFSFLFGNPPVGWHDSLSNTRVAKESSLFWVK